MQRSFHSQSEHDALVTKLVMHLQQNGFVDIKADHIPNMTRPDAVGGYGLGVARHVPDATASFAGDRFVFEVETSDSIESSHAESQLRTFANAGTILTPVKMVVVVPEVAEYRAQQVLSGLGLSGEVWTG